MDMDVIYNPNLVLYLPLWKRDGVTIRSDDGYGHICTKTGVTWEMQGGTFDGDDLINCGNSPAIAITGDSPRTVLAWVNCTNLTNHNTILSYGAVSSGNLVYFRVDQTSGQITLNPWGDAVSTTNTVTVGSWFFVGFTMSGQDWALYRNDDAAVTGTFALVTINTSASNVFIGQRVDGAAGTFFIGRIGEVRESNRVLSALEVHQYRLATKWLYT